MNNCQLSEQKSQNNWLRRRFAFKRRHFKLYRRHFAHHRQRFVVKRRHFVLHRWHFVFQRRHSALYRRHFTLQRRHFVLHRCHSVDIYLAKIIKRVVSAFVGIYSVVKLISTVRMWWLNRHIKKSDANIRNMFHLIKCF